MKDLRGDFPRSIQGISLEWLNGVLSDWGGIQACRCEAHPEQGVTSQVYILHLQCARGGRLQPQQVLVKLATDSAAARDALSESRAFRREIDFYRELGGCAGIAVPRCYALGYDEADHSFLLLLEYLGDCSVRDVLVGTVGEVTTAVDALAGFHARWWGRAAELPFIQREGDEAQLRNRLARLGVALDNIRAHHRREVGETLIELLELFIPHAALLAAEARSGPLTLCHGDYHRKQLLFPDNDAGRFCVIDWQTVCIDRGANDLARIVVTGLTGAQRRRHETALVERYHRRLCDAGVEDYPLEQLWQHYALGVARLLAIHSLVFAGFDIAPLIQQWRDKGADWYEVLFRWPAEAAAERGIQSSLSDFIERLPGAAPRARALRAGP